MPAVSIAPAQHYVSKFWNVISCQGEKNDRNDEGKQILLNEVVSISSSSETLHLPELAQGRNIRQAAEELVEERETAQNSSFKCTTPMKVGAGVVAGTGLFTGMLLCLKYALGNETQALTTPETSPAPLYTTDVTVEESTQHSEKIKLPFRRLGRTPGHDTPQGSVNTINNIFNKLQQHLPWSKPQDILGDVHNLQWEIAKGINTNALSAWQIGTLGKNIADFSANKIDPIIRQLKETKEGFKQHSFQDNFNQLRIESVNLELNDVRRAKNILGEIITTLNHAYINYIANHAG